MDRFGDVEFLAELWQKARGELPGRLETLHQLVAQEEKDVDRLGDRMHKLRGLVSNFLTEKKAIGLLVTCEKQVERGELSTLESRWEEFESQLQSEVKNLDDWIASRS